MTFVTPQHIIPKFLWKHIIEYMSYYDIVKMTTITKYFAGLIEEDVGQSDFLEHRSNAIAIVKCNARRMDYFWKYVLQTYIGCDNINDLFQYIENDIKHSTNFIYYKVFIQAGEYLFDNNTNKRYVLNQHRCSIEVNGSKSGSTLIKHIINRNEYAYRQEISVVIPEYFLMCHINFHNVTCNFTKYNPETYLKYIEDDNFIEINYYSELYVHNCIYAESCGSNLKMICIDKTTIVNCVFDTGLFIGNTNSLLNGSRLKPSRLELNSNAICDISCSTFLLNNEYKCVSIVNHMFIMIFFTNNTILKATWLFTNWYDNKIVIKANNNKICNVDTCVRNCNVKFINNHFNNVGLLCDTIYSNIIADDTNQFINCDKQLMDQIKIENIKQ